MQITVLGFSEPRLNLPRNTVSIASVAITLDGHTITVTDLRVIAKNQAFWIGMPSVKNVQGVWGPVVQLSASLKRSVEAAVLEAYEKWSLGQRAETLPANGGVK